MTSAPDDRSPEPGTLHDLCAGHGEELQEMAAFILAGQSTSIVGPHNSGKTTLIQALFRPTVRASLGLVASHLFVRLSCETLVESTLHQVFGQFAEGIAAVLAEADLPAEPALAHATAHPDRFSFEAALRRLQRRGLRVVLFLDDFERLGDNPLLDVTFFNALRSIAARYPVVYVTASRQPLIDLTYTARAAEILSSPFFNIFAPVVLRPDPQRTA